MNLQKIRNPESNNNNNNNKKMKEEDGESTNQMGFPRRLEQSKMRECRSVRVSVEVRECRTKGEEVSD